MKANINDLQTVFSELPSRYIYENTTYDNYQLLTELHFQQGWRNVELPIITEVQKLSDNYILVGDIITKEVIDLTAEEIAEKNKILVPANISAMALKLQLFDLDITDNDIFADIDSIPDSMFPLVEKEKAKIKYKTATHFDRNNADLNLIATMEGLTQEQVDTIFINGNSF